jgi:hypothetical protein
MASAHCVARAFGIPDEEQPNSLVHDKIGQIGWPWLITNGRPA